jgi:hypothetical protein
MKLSEEKVHFSLNLEAVSEAVGVSTNCVSGGIAAGDTCRMMFDVGYHLHDKLLSVSILDYNPRVED